MPVTALVYGNKARPSMQAHLTTGAHLAAGRQIVRLAIEWGEQLACVLGNDLVVRRLRFLDLVQQEADDTRSDDAAANFDAEFATLNAELSRFIPRLIEVMGGLPVE